VTDELHLWQWPYTDQFGKRRVYPCRLTEEDAKHLRDAERVAGSLEVRRSIGQTSDWQRSLQPSEWTDASSPPGICSDSGSSQI
jgi:hypothetical protein